MSVLIWALCAATVAIAFGLLILRPALGAYSGGWEKLAAGFLSIFVLVALVGVGVAVGFLVFLNWDGWFG